MTDHDLLIRIETTISNINDRLSRYDDSFKSLHRRITILECGYWLTVGFFIAVEFYFKHMR